MSLFYLPPYSPQLNLMEGVWKWLKESVINTVFFPNVDKIKKNVNEFLNWVNQDLDTVVNRLYVRM
ncbi:transposase [Sporosarcina limicola]|uniref:transposase n=1 Tax=Sporosarcina limicola TaxID=34101 RepID=UPI001CEF0FBD